MLKDVLTRVGFGKETEIFDPRPKSLQEKVNHISIDHYAGMIVDLAMSLDEDKKEKWVQSITKVSLGSTLPEDHLGENAEEDSEAVKISLAFNLFTNGFRIPNFHSLTSGRGEALSVYMNKVTGLPVPTLEGENLKELMVSIGERMLETVIDSDE